MQAATMQKNCTHIRKLITKLQQMDPHIQHATLTPGTCSKNELQMQCFCRAYNFHTLNLVLLLLLLLPLYTPGNKNPRS